MATTRTNRAKMTHFALHQTSVIIPLLLIIIIIIHHILSFTQEEQILYSVGENTEDEIKKENW